MTREELEDRLNFDAEAENNDFQYGIPLDAGNDVVSLLLIRQNHREPYSVYTVLELSEEQEWRGPTELWEVVWRIHYQVVVAEYARRSLRPGEDPRDYPQSEDYRRCESHIISTAEEVEKFLGSYGRSLADFGQIFPHCPPLVLVN